MKTVLLVIFVLFIGSGIGGILYYARHRPAEPAHPPDIIPTATPKLTAFSLEESPQKSLRGNITSRSGEILWLSRIATAVAQLPPIPAVQQGEVLVTQDDGSITLTFAPAGTVQISPNSRVDIIQTLPPHLVFEQTQGQAAYQVEGLHDLSVRSFHLLVELQNGTMTVTIDEETGDITLRVTSGIATAAYNDSEFISRTIELQPGDRFVYSESLREGVIE